MLKLKENSLIYIYAPANYASGGPEALHQLYYYFLKAYGKNINIKMVYYGMKENISPICARYEKYGIEYISENEIIDNENNILIVPEVRAYKLSDYNNVQKCIWWLSILNYFDDHTKIFYMKKYIRSLLVGVFKKNFKSLRYWIEMKNRFKRCPNYRNGDIYNFCGSKFAYDYLKQEGTLNLEYLVEPISKEFLDFGICKNLSGAERENTVLYNPSKGSTRMEKILKNNKFKFVPIKDYTPEQQIELYRKSKLYVDFGRFPGPERIPKETVYNGMVILVTKNNASVNDFDVAIPDKYKLSPKASIKDVEKQMQYMLDNYDNIINDFEYFRQKIDNLDKNFIEQIKNIFKFED